MTLWTKEKQQVYIKQWFKDNPEKKRQYHLNYRINSRELYLLNSAKKRAKKQEIPLDITVEDVVIPEVCPVFKIPFVLDNLKQSSNSPSLDRIDNTKGYTKGNVQVISALANVMKNKATPEQLLLFADWVYKTYGN